MDVELLCSAFGLNYTAASMPSRHYVISHPSQQTVLTIPLGGPISSSLIRALVAYTLASAASSSRQSYPVSVAPAETAIN